MKIAITGHTQGLGQCFYQVLESHGHEVHGFSLSTGFDLRNYSHVSCMLEQIQDFDVFINNAKPDFSQTQILYRLVRTWSQGLIINIGSGILDEDPEWTDTHLLEYYTQKISLAHAVKVLSPVTACKLILLNPEHTDQPRDYVERELSQLGL